MRSQNGNSMKPKDKFGRPIYAQTFGILQRIGKKLLKHGWKESQSKPNLFYIKFEDTIVFADMRGTDVIPIWEEPSPLLYETGKIPWKRRRVLRIVKDQLEYYEIPYRFSFYYTDEPGGLFFGEDDELADGQCRMCNSEINHDGLFCSTECEESYSQLKELRREEREQKTECVLCGKALDLFSKDTVKHHISYNPEKIVYVCRKCHTKIHLKHKKYPNLAPKKPPDWKSPQIADYNIPEFLKLEKDE